MTQQEIIELAAQAGFERVIEVNPHTGIKTVETYATDSLERFAKLVAEKEKERISQKIAQLPFGDTAQSLSIWVKNDTM